MAEMKPCPFCGSIKQTLLSPTCQRHDEYDPDTRAFPIIRCGGCFTDVPGTDWDNSGNSAVAAWNRRAAEAVVTGRLKAIIDWCDLAMKNPEEFDSHGVRLLDGPVFDEARAAIIAASKAGA